jgi:hypothetical protein
VEFAARYAQLRYFSEVCHSSQDFCPLIRDAFVEYKPCYLSADVFEVLYCESDIAESEYVIGQGCDCSDISVVGVAGWVGLPIDGFHISINDFSNIFLKRLKQKILNAGIFV